MLGCLSLLHPQLYVRLGQLAAFAAAWLSHCGSWPKRWWSLIACCAREQALLSSPATNRECLANFTCSSSFQIPAIGAARRPQHSQVSLTRAWTGWYLELSSHALSHSEAVGVGTARVGEGAVYLCYLQTKNLCLCLCSSTASLAK